uniref:PilT/PilU family type 4a pilus ATPase n=1 Tax=candidate division CPR3 bacterium TaxID=2268181 RepID=A0A7C4R4D3_UNCC3
MNKENDTTEYMNIPEINKGKSEIYSLVDIAISFTASDLILSAGSIPTMRVDGKLLPIYEKPRLTPGYIEKLVNMLINDDHKKELKEKKEVDFSYSFKDKAFLRINVFYQKGVLSCVIRIIPGGIKDFDDLNLPSIIKKFSYENHGLVLVTGPSGCGKSTTIAAILEEVNRTRSVHILTIEDPIEYVFKPKQSIIDQRELKRDTLLYSNALKSSFREDFDVIFIGELRDRESIEAALNIAESGHLVFSTIHSIDAVSAPDRIINFFPADMHGPVRNQLSNVLLGIVAQKLLPKVDGGRIPAVEVMLNNQAVKNIIRDGKTDQLKNVIQISGDIGMISFEKSINELIKCGKVIKQ